MCLRVELRVVFGGRQYGHHILFVLVDDFSRKSWVVLLKNKNDVEVRLKE